MRIKLRNNAKFLHEYHVFLNFLETKHKKKVFFSQEFLWIQPLVLNTTKNKKLEALFLKLFYPSALRKIHLKWKMTIRYLFYSILLYSILCLYFFFFGIFTTFILGGAYPGVIPAVLKATKALALTNRVHSSSFGKYCKYTNWII